MLLSIVIPVHNEDGNLRELYRQVKEQVTDAGEIIFVDDGSTDASLDTLQAIAHEDPVVKVVSLQYNSGQTAALSAGFACAQGEWIVTLDADLQNDPGDVPKLVATAKKGYDVVSGWRKDRQDRFLSRTLPSMTANGIISFFTGVKLHDYGCTLKIYRSEFLKDIPLYGEMHRFLPAYLAWNGAKIAEIEVRHHPRKRGRSHYGLERTLKVVLDLIVTKYFFSYVTKPMYIFGGAGAVSLAIGVLSALVVLIRKLSYGGEWISPLIFVSFFMTGIAVICLLLGFVAEVLTRVYFESKGKTVYRTRKKINC